MMDEHVAPRDRLEHRRAARRTGSRARIADSCSAGSSGSSSCVETAKVEQAVDLLDVGDDRCVARAGARVADPRAAARAASGGMLRSTSRRTADALAALRGGARDFVEQIVGVRLVELELGASRHAKDERLLERRPRDTADRDSPARAPRCERTRARRSSIDLEEARQRSRGRSTSAKRGGPPARFRMIVAMASDRCAKPRQRMARAQRHRERREDRMNLVAEALAQATPAASARARPTGTARTFRAVPAPRQQSRDACRLSRRDLGQPRRGSPRAAPLGVSPSSLCSSLASRAPPLTDRPCAP